MELLPGSVLLDGGLLVIKMPVQSQPPACRANQCAAVGLKGRFSRKIKWSDVVRIPYISLGLSREILFHRTAIERIEMPVRSEIPFTVR